MKKFFLAVLCVAMMAACNNADPATNPPAWERGRACTPGNSGTMCAQMCNGYYPNVTHRRQCLDGVLAGVS